MTLRSHHHTIETTMAIVGSQIQREPTNSQYYKAKKHGIAPDEREKTHNKQTTHTRRGKKRPHTVAHIEESSYQQAAAQQQFKKRARTCDTTARTCRPECPTETKNTRRPNLIFLLVLSYSMHRFSFNYICNRIFFVVFVYAKIGWHTRRPNVVVASWRAYHTHAHTDYYTKYWFIFPLASYLLRRARRSFASPSRRDSFYLISNIAMLFLS